MVKNYNFMNRLAAVIVILMLLAITTNAVFAQGKVWDPKMWSRIYPTAQQPSNIIPPQAPPSELPPSAPRMVMAKDGPAIIGPNYRVYPHATYTQSEMSIWVDPNNQNIVIGGSNAASWPTVSTLSQGWYITTNGGTSWDRGGDTLPPHIVAGLSNYTSDPSVGIDLDGNMYFNTLLYSSTTGDVVTAKSTNKGLTWGNFVAVPNPGYDEDKSHFTVDNNPSSTYKGNLYTAYSEFGSTPTLIEFSRSTDGNTSWSAPVVISGGASTDQGVNLQVGPNGEVYGCWTSYTSYPSSSVVGFNKSTNGGVTWGTQISATPAIADIRGNLTKGGYSVRVNSFPSMAVDRSTGPHRGWIYITYPANPGGNPDIYLVKSTNSGTSWSTPIKVNQNTESSVRDQWFSWATVDPSTGHLYIVYYDSRDFATNDTTGVYLSRSIDGGVTFEDFRIHDQGFVLQPIGGLASYYAGDYIGVTALNGRVYPFWNDNRIGADHHQGYTASVQFPANFGYVKGNVSTLLGKNAPLQGVAVDFVGATIQMPGVSDVNGDYIAGASVDTNNGYQLYTIRGQKFGYNVFTDTVTLVLNDTLVGRNIPMTPAAGGLMSGRVYNSDDNGIKAHVQIRYNGNLVVDDLYSDSATGNFSYPLPNGSYDLKVDPPSPYATRDFLGVVINSDTPYVNSLVRWVVEPSPLALRDTLGVNQSNTKNLTLTNTTSSSVPYRISNDEALKGFIVPPQKLFDDRSPLKDPNITFGKGEADPRFGPAVIKGNGGPDAFGYVWIDSDDPSGPTYNWTDITGVGTQITTWSGSADDGYATVALPFSFPYYENSYSSINIVTNGFVNFGATSTAYSNGAIPSTAVPNDALYGFWDDLTLSTSGTVHYYYDAPNARFIVQYTNVPSYAGGSTYTYQIILKQNGEILYQYNSMTGTLNSSTIGIENSAGTIGLQVVYSNTYVHDNLAVLFKLRGVDWLSHDPNAGTIDPLGSVVIVNTFDATDLIPSTTYNATVFVDVTHPDVQGSIDVPASLRVEPLSGPGISVTPLTKNFGNVVIGHEKKDSVKVRNIGTSTLNVTEISSTNARFAVDPTSGTILPDDSMKVYITFTPQMPAGAQSGTIHILSNDPLNDTVDVAVSGTGVGVPHFAARLDSLNKNLEGGAKDSIQFYVRNDGTLDGDLAARAVMYPRELGKAFSDPIILPLKLKHNLNATTTGRILLVSDNAGLASYSAGKGVDPAPTPASLLASSSSRIYNALVAGGFIVDSVSFATHDPSTYGNYDLVIWSSGANTATMFNDATKRAALVTRVNNGGKVWVEGGEVGWIYRQTAEVDINFRHVDLHDSTWTSDVSTCNLHLIVPTHPVFTTPNTITEPVMFTGTGYGPRDAVRLIPNDPNAYKIAGWTPTYPDTAGIIIWNNNDIPTTIFTTFAFGAITDSTVAMNLAQNIATFMVGSGSAAGPWLSIKPKSDTVAVSDSTLMTAGFDATDPSIYNNPGYYYGRVEITAVGAPLADSLKIPARMFVVPAGGARLAVDQSSLNYGNVALFDSSTKSVLVRNIGQASLSITDIPINNAKYTASPTSFSLNSLDTQRVFIKFKPVTAGIESGTMSFTCNDPLAPTVSLTGRGIGVPHIVVVPDTFYFNMPSGPDTSRQTMKIKNTGTDTLRYTVEEIGTGSIAYAKPNTDPAVVLPKDAPDTRHGQDMLLSSGGPDAFGYRWLDSDEPGGPAYNWTDISSIGTLVSFSSTDDGYATISLPFSFKYYGVDQTSVNIVTNGFVNFGATSTAYSNGTIPSTATPNNAAYAFWDDLDVGLGGGVYYYNDVANSQFIIQYNNVPHHTSGGPYTFQVILKQTGDILCQYKTMSTAVTSATVGIENSTGTVGLQVVYNASYIHDNLALLFTPDLYPWMSTNIVTGTIVQGDSQNVEVRAHPGLIQGGTYTGRLRVKGTGSPDTAKVGVRLDVVGGTPFISVTAPNGGETYIVGQSYNITWNKNMVDNVKIEYSTNAGSSWILVTPSAPAKSAPMGQHPKVAFLTGKNNPSSVNEVMGSYSWVVPNTPTTQALVKVSDRDNAAVVDVSNNVFTITATLPPVWSVQNSNTTSALYSVSVVNDQVAWTVGTAGVVRRTTNGGTNWIAVATLAGEAHQVCGVSADVALACVNISTGNDGRIYLTTNGGAGWTMVYQNTGTGAFMDAVTMFDALNGVAVGDPVSAQWVLLKTTDGGATWASLTTLAQQATEVGWNNSFAWTDNQTGWFGTDYYKVYRTTNGGTSWLFSSTVSKNSYGVAFPTSQLGMIGDSAGATDKTTNGGAIWSAASLAGTGSMIMPAAVPIPTVRWWVTSNTSVYKTTNQGSTWTLDHSSSAAFNHIAMKVVQSANVIVGYAVGASGVISKYVEALPVAQNGTISGVKFEDVDGDSVKDPGEPLLAGWKIYLSGPGIADSVVTDGQGAYMFDSLSAGTYVVSEESRTGWVRTAPATASYTINLGPNENAVNKDFGNFKLGSLSGMKWKDVNGNGSKDIDEPALPEWTIKLAGEKPGSAREAQTDINGAYSFIGLAADVYTVSEVLQEGYTQTYPPFPGTHVLTMRSGLDSVGLNFGNFYPDTTFFRTFLADSFAYAKDAKNKIGKLVKRTPDKVAFKFNLVVPTILNANLLKLEFSMNVTGKIYLGKDKLDSIASFSVKKPPQFTLPVSGGETIQIEGMGAKGKPIKVKYAFAGLAKQTVTEYKLNQPGLPMPNAVNMVYELFVQQAFTTEEPLVVGKLLSGVEAMRYGWVQLKGYKDVFASLYARGGIVHSGSPRAYDMYGTKAFIGMKKTCPPKKHDNMLFAELLALRLNIVASATGKTPVGFGDLIYDDGSAGAFCGKTVIEIAAQADNFITYGEPYPKPNVSGDSLYNVIRRINGSFVGPVDTVGFVDKLVFKGVRRLSEVPFLKPNVGIQPTTIALKPGIVPDEPSIFALYQNYPNPFNPSTVISFDIPTLSVVTLKVYNILGQEVAVLLDHQLMDEGENSIDFNANNLANGVYFYRLIAEPINEDVDSEDMVTGPQVYQSIKKALLLK